MDRSKILTGFGLDTAVAAFFLPNWSHIRLSTVKRLLTVVCVGTLSAAAGCKKSDAAPQGGGMMGPAVTVAVTQAEEMPVYLEEIGKASASASVTIQPQVTGRIMAKHFTDGQDIKKDAPLFNIDPAPFLAVEHQAEGQLKKDQAMANNAKSVVNRDKEALAGNKGAIAQTQMDSDQAAFDEASASIEADNAAIQAAKVNLDYCTINSPIDGRAGARLVDVGNIVTAPSQGSGTSLLTIQTLDPIYIDFTINEAELSRVQQFMKTNPHLKVRVSLPQDTDQSTGAAHPTTIPTAAPGALHPDVSNSAVATPATMPADPWVEGDLDFLDNAVQDGSGTVKMRATLKNADHHFWPGQFVNVHLILEMKQGAILVPRQATQVSQTGPFVYTVDANSIAHLTPVVLGQREGESVLVESGLKPGDKVVVTGQMLIQPGAPVTVVPSGPPGGAGGH
jgi:multidrug efflux system membrane fusion protein